MQVVAPHLVLTGCIEIMKTSLSSSPPGVALAYNICSRQHLDHRKYAHQRYATHLFFVVWAYLASQNIVVLQTGCVSLYYLVEESVLYLVSARFVMPLPVSKGKFVSWSIDFIMDLPLRNGHTAIFTCIDRLTKYYRLIFCFVKEGALSTSSVAKLFFKKKVRFFGVPVEMTIDREPRFPTPFS